MNEIVMYYVDDDWACRLYQDGSVAYCRHFEEYKLPGKVSYEQFMETVYQ